MNTSLRLVDIGPLFSNQTAIDTDLIIVGCWRTFHPRTRRRVPFHATRSRTLGRDCTCDLQQSIPRSAFPTQTGRDRLRDHQVRDTFRSPWSTALTFLDLLGVPLREKANTTSERSRHSSQSARTSQSLRSQGRILERLPTPSREGYKLLLSN